MAASTGVFLKRLAIKGFKSFADQAVLDVEPGVTVVVGPNGSGKSNVVDAIAWVLGAQAPSAVRSQKMDDVIFAGTAERAALDRAEVTLTIDNDARLLPIDVAEVTISRTLLRTGESEYSLNPRPTSTASATSSARCAASCDRSSARPRLPAVTATWSASSAPCAATAPPSN